MYRIVGYGVAAERALRTMEERTAKEIEVRDYMIKRSMKRSRTAN